MSRVGISVDPEPGDNTQQPTGKKHDGSEENFVAQPWFSEEVDCAY